MEAAHGSVSARDPHGRRRPFRQPTSQPGRAWWAARRSPGRQHGDRSGPRPHERLGGAGGAQREARRVGAARQRLGVEPVDHADELPRHLAGLGRREGAGAASVRHDPLDQRLPALHLRADGERQGLVASGHRPALDPDDGQLVARAVHQGVDERAESPGRVGDRVDDLLDLAHLLLDEVGVHAGDEVVHGRLVVRDQARGDPRPLRDGAEGERAEAVLARDRGRGGHDLGGALGGGLAGARP